MVNHLVSSLCALINAQSDETSHHDLVALDHDLQEFLKRKGRSSQSLPHILLCKTDK